MNEELKKRILSRYGTITAFCEDMGLTNHAVSRWIHGGVAVPAQKIPEVSEKLRIRSWEIGRVFFPEVE